MNYTEVTRIIDYLESTDGLIAITPVNLSGFVAHTQSINAEGDIVPGSVNTADLSFTLLDIRGSVSSYQDREFIYRKGYALPASRERLAVPSSAYIKTDSLTVYTSANGRSLTVESGTESNTYSLTAEAGALYLNGNTLTVLYAGEPYAEQYTVSGATLSGPTAPDMLAYDKNIASEYAFQNASYVASGDTVTEFKVLTILNIRYLDTTVFEMHTKGIFKASRPTRGTGGQYTVTATDRMELFSADCISVLNSSPATASDLLAATCTAVGVTLAQQDRYNADFAIVVPEDQESCTGQQILTWLGEIMGCSWHINAAGELESVWFAKKDVRLTRDDYTSFSYETFMVAPIDKVMTGSSYADVVGVGGTGGNVLLVDGNALIPYTLQDDLNTFSEGLLEHVATVPEYRPGTLSGYANADLAPGDVIQVDNDDDESEYVCITQMTENGFVITVTSSGNQRREVQNYTGTSLQVLKRSLDQLNQQVGEFPKRWSDDIEETINSITGAMGGTRVDLFNPDTGKPSGTAYLFDGDDIKTAKKLLVLNAGGIAYYENGFNVEDPGASVPSYVVMNNEGKVDASSILTGVLTAIVIQSADKESFYADLENGIIRIKATEFSVQGKTVDTIASEVANTAAKDAVDAQTQEDVFNKLTNNGTAQGLYLTDGNVYIDATYMVTGTLDADKVTVVNLDASSITSGTISSDFIDVSTLKIDTLYYLNTPVIYTTGGQTTVGTLSRRVDIYASDITAYDVSTTSLTATSKLVVQSRTLTPTILTPFIYTASFVTASDVALGLSRLISELKRCGLLY